MTDIGKPSLILKCNKISKLSIFDSISLTKLFKIILLVLVFLIKEQNLRHNHNHNN